ncbi:MAG: hypothetical protein PHS34_08225 [Candidatus Omnitrophica bacterium]|nr:hypothetical protein [Candidatus Omnitrophota bacterium]
METAAQLGMYLLKTKKIAGFVVILLTWLFFLIVDIFGTVIGMDRMMNTAKDNRLQFAVTAINSDDSILLLDQQIKTAQKSIDSYQLSYDTEAQKEKPEWWILAKYEAALEAAKLAQDIKIKQRQELIDKQKTETKNKEIMVDEQGEIQRFWKICIAIALGLIVDLGSCIVIMCSWIFEKKVIVEEKKEIVINKNKLEIQEAKEERKLSFADYVELYYDKRKSGDSKNILKGKAEVDGIPDNIYKKITNIAVHLGYIIKKNTQSYFNSGIIKQQFIDGIVEGNKNHVLDSKKKEESDDDVL